MWSASTTANANLKPAQEAGFLMPHVQRLLQLALSATVWLTDRKRKYCNSKKDLLRYPCSIQDDDEMLELV